MKTRFIAAIAVLSLFAVSCSREERLDLNPSDQTISAEPSFSVIEESVMTAEQLFDATAASLQGTIDEESYLNLRQTFLTTSENLSELDPQTKAIVPALYKTVRVEYMTPDQDKQMVKASALIVYPLLKKIKDVMLINHGTHIGFMLVPSKYTCVEGIMAATGALCIMPDYIGLGSTKNHPDLYLNHEVHGTTSVDALLTLLDYAKAKKLPLDPAYKTYVLGYSQGGSVSLATLKRIQQLDAATQQRLHLEKVYCGDGPYDLRLTFETYLQEFHQGKKMGMGAVIPSVINSMFNSYPSEVADMNYEDFFTPWALKTGVPQAIRSNKEGIIDMIVKLNGAYLDDILNMDYLEANPEHLERLLSLMDRQNLCLGWKPQYKLQLLHCNPDGVVPFTNFEEAYANLNNEYMQEPEIISLNTKLISEPLLQHIAGMVVMMEKVMICDI